MNIQDPMQPLIHGPPHSHTPPHQFQRPFQIRQLPPTMVQQSPPSIVQQPPLPILQQPPPSILHQSPPLIQQQPPPSIIHQPPPSIVQQLPPSIVQQPPPSIEHRASSSQMNGLAKGAPPSPCQEYKNQQYPSEIKPNVPGSSNPGMYRDETIKNPHQFGQDSKSATVPNEQSPSQMPVAAVVKQMVHPVQASPSNIPTQQPSPPLTQQSVNHREEKFTNILKTFTPLNPNAKEFVFNPTFKQFQSRSPSTPLARRPNAPQTPRHNISATVGGSDIQSPLAPLFMPLQHGMSSQPLYQQWRLPIRTDIEQMQVAATTGQQLLAPPPFPHLMYPAAMNQVYPPMHMLGHYEPSPQIQYMQSNFHSSPIPYLTELPQYNPAQQPQAPLQQCKEASPPPPLQSYNQFPSMYPIIPTQSHMMQSMQYMQQVPPPHPPHQVLIYQHAGQGNSQVHNPSVDAEQ